MYVQMDVCMHVYHARIEIYFSTTLLWLRQLQLCNHPLRTVLRVC